MKENFIIAAFKDRDRAGEAIDELEELGYTAEDVSIIAKENGKVVERDGNKAEEGAITGGVIGGIAGLLAGAGIIPALAGLLAGGPLIAALGLAGAAATAATGAVAGGLIGALAGAGIPEESARAYDTTVQEGGVIIGVSVDDEEEVDEVREVFDSHGAERTDAIETKER